MINVGSRGSGSVRSARGWPVWTALGVAATIVQLVAVYRPSEPPLPSDLPNLDKLGHAALFAAPVFCLLLANRFRAGRFTAPFCWLLPAVFVAHAVLSEIVQHAFFRHRDGDPFDALADITGIGLAVLGAGLITRVSGRKARRRGGAAGRG